MVGEGSGRGSFVEESEGGDKSSRAGVMEWVGSRCRKLLVFQRGAVNVLAKKGSLRRSGGFADLTMF